MKNSKLNLLISSSALLYYLLFVQVSISQLNHFIKLLVKVKPKKKSTVLDGIKIPQLKLLSP